MKCRCVRNISTFLIRYNIRLAISIRYEDPDGYVPIFSVRKTDPLLRRQNNIKMDLTEVGFGKIY